MTGPYIVIAVGVVLVFIAVVLDLCERRVRQVQRSLQAEVDRLRDAINTYVGAIDERDRCREALECIAEADIGHANCWKLRDIAQAALDGDR